MSTGIKKIEKGEYLFHEGDPSDCMFVIKTGRIAITKPTTNGEIELAQLTPGAMLGEMAFFDNKPRSASARALQQTSCIVLPFSALHAQFKTFPEWSKAIMRTVNEHLRNANKRIKELEKLNKEDPDLFPAHSICKMVSIINFVSLKWGQKSDEGIVISSERLRKYTIQVFGEATNRMERLTEELEQCGLLKIENTGDGVKKITVFNTESLAQFVEWYNGWLFAKPEDQIVVKEEELRLVRALLHFGKSVEPDETGTVKISLTKVQNKSMEELNELFKVDDFNGLAEKGFITEKMMASDGIYTSFVKANLEQVLPFWGIVHRLRKIRRAV